MVQNNSKTHRAHLAISQDAHLPENARFGVTAFSGTVSMLPLGFLIIRFIRLTSAEVVAITMNACVNITGSEPQPFR